MIIGQQKRNLKAPGFPDFGIFLCSGMNLFTFAGKKAVNIEVIRGMNRKIENFRGVEEGTDNMPKNRRKPMLFQGNLNKHNYFEGWYYQQVNQAGTMSLALIPGVSLVEGDQHCFIQYILSTLDEQGKNHYKTGYVRYPMETFHYLEDAFKIQVGKSIFTEKKIFLDLQDGELNFLGTIEIHPFTPIRRSLYAPGIMGPFTYFPGMQCNHGVISMKHDVMGSIQMNDITLKFNYGRGYIEKDWGTSFPEEYIWIQSNSFDKEDTALFFSVADIPFLFQTFQGLIANVVIKGKEYRFATYNRSRLSDFHKKGNQIFFTLENKVAKMSVTAEQDGEGELIAPNLGKMEKTIKEGLTGKVHLTLFDKKEQKTYERKSRIAGMEVVLCENRRRRKLKFDHEERE